MDNYEKLVEYLEKELNKFNEVNETNYSTQNMPVYLFEKLLSKYPEKDSVKYFLNTIYPDTETMVPRYQVYRDQGSYFEEVNNIIKDIKRESLNTANSFGEIHSSRTEEDARVYVRAKGFASELDLTTLAKHMKTIAFHYRHMEEENGMDGDMGTSEYFRERAEKMESAIEEIGKLYNTRIIPELNLNDVLKSVPSLDVNDLYLESGTLITKNKSEVERLQKEIKSLEGVQEIFKSFVARKAENPVSNLKESPVEDLFRKLFSLEYGENGAVGKGWFLKANTPRIILEKIYSGENVPSEWLTDGSSVAEFQYHTDEFEECDKLRELFEKDGIRLNLLECIEIWYEYSNDSMASWLVWMDPPEINVLYKIREELLYRTRTVDWS